jgi:hypothetical protein
LLLPDQAKRSLDSEYSTYSSQAGCPGSQMRGRPFKKIDPAEVEYEVWTL